jgi:hypothetical protein
LSKERSRKRRRINGCSLTKHHITPKCRKGKGYGDTVKIPWLFHDSWHDLFGLMTPEEAILYIVIIFRIDIIYIVFSLKFGLVKIDCIVRFFSRRLLKDPEIFCEKWNFLFGDLSPRKAILFIEIVMRSENFGIAKKKWTIKELGLLRENLKNIKTVKMKKIIKVLKLENYQKSAAA